MDGSKAALSHEKIKGGIPPAAPGLVLAPPGKEKDRVQGMHHCRPRESQALGQEARHAMERACCGVRQEVAV